MKTIALSTAASLLLFGLSLTPFAAARQESPAAVLTGKDQPILLKRMVVIAAPLP